MNYDDQNLMTNTEKSRLELEIDNNTAFIDYRLSGSRLYLIHTEVPPLLEGKGVGKAIVQKALQYAKDSDLKIVPICPFVQAYLKRHTEWTNIIAEGAEKFINKD
jgi:predicted GNAT family acetyltransferase